MCIWLSLGTLVQFLVLMFAVMLTLGMLSDQALKAGLPVATALPTALQAPEPALDPAKMAVRAAYRKFLDQAAWDKAFTAAFIKMVTMYGNFKLYTGFAAVPINVPANAKVGGAICSLGSLQACNMMRKQDGTPPACILPNATTQCIKTIFRIVPVGFRMA